MPRSLIRRFADFPASLEGIEMEKRRRISIQSRECRQLTRSSCGKIVDLRREWMSLFLLYAVLKVMRL